MIEVHSRNKYKVWNITLNRFEKDALLGQDGIPFILDLNTKELFIIENAEIVHSTGLKDKNGKLIYEGDIISDGYDNTVVEWSNNDCQFLNVQVDDGIKTCYTFEQLLSMEVVGNIYENIYEN